MSTITENKKLKAGWDVTEFGNFVERSSKKHNPKKDNETFKCLELEHFEQKTGKINGFVDSNLQASIKNKFSKGDVLFGKLRPYLKKYFITDFEGVCSSEVWVLKGVKGLCANEYLFYLVQTHKFIETCNKTSGSKMPRADWSLVCEEPFLLPPLPEQQKIAKILSTWDVAIDKLSQLITQKEKHKKGLMQVLLTGKIRFDEFTEEWGEVKLGDIAKFSKGKGISKSDISPNGKLECIRYGELYTKYRETINQVISRTNVEANQLVLSEENDIIIPASGETQLDIATASCVRKTGVALGGDLNIIKTKEDGVFLSYYLNVVKKTSIARLSQGISVIHLYSKQLASLNLSLPNVKEQRKIASVLTISDNEIKNLKGKLEVLKNQKKGLMQELLTGKTRVKI